MGSVQFSGQGPYALPMTQHTLAHAVGTSVEVHIRLLSNPTNPQSLSTAVVTLTVEQARLLVSQLSAALLKT